MGMIPKNIAVFGSGGAIGGALARRLSVLYPEAKLHAFSRDKSSDMDINGKHHTIDYEDEASIAASVLAASEDGVLDLVLVATGILHDETLKPEKSLRDISAEKFQRIFAINTIVPALIAKHALGKLNRDQPSVFGVLSARVGSISDNQIGGWYAYRASKAALNMLIKNAAIEVARRNKNAIVVGLHPGTVDSNLSKPFQGNVQEGKLFTPDHAAHKLLEVIVGLRQGSSGKCFAWDGEEIAP